MIHALTMAPLSCGKYLTDSAAKVEAPLSGRELERSIN